MAFISSFIQLAVCFILTDLILWDNVDILSNGSPLGVVLLFFIFTLLVRIVPIINYITWLIAILIISITGMSMPKENHFSNSVTKLIHWYKSKRYKDIFLFTFLWYLSNLLLFGLFVLIFSNTDLALHVNKVSLFYILIAWLVMHVIAITIDWIKYILGYRK